MEADMWEQLACEGKAVHWVTNSSLSMFLNGGIYRSYEELEEPRCSRTDGRTEAVDRESMHEAEAITYRKVANKSRGLSLYKPRPSCSYY